MTRTYEVVTEATWGVTEPGEQVTTHHFIDANDRHEAVCLAIQEELRRPGPCFVKINGVHRIDTDGPCPHCQGSGLQVRKRVRV